VIDIPPNEVGPFGPSALNMTIRCLPEMSTSSVKCIVDLTRARYNLDLITLFGPIRPRKPTSFYWEYGYGLNQASLSINNEESERDGKNNMASRPCQPVCHGDSHGSGRSCPGTCPEFDYLSGQRSELSPAGQGSVCLSRVGYAAERL
jgi:hypothetical protein